MVSFKKSVALSDMWCVIESSIIFKTEVVVICTFNKSIFMILWDEGYCTCTNGRVLSRC